MICVFLNYASVNCVRLLNVIESDHSIAQYIRELEVPVPNSCHGGSAVVPLIKNLLHLLRLCVYIPNGNWFVHPLSKMHPTIMDTIATRASLQHLELHFVVLDDTNQIFRLIRHLTNLHDLDLLCTMFDVAQLHSQSQPKASRVTKLAISCTSLMRLLGHPESGPIDLLKITHLKVPLFYADPSDFNRLVSAAMSLERLEITVGIFVGL